MRSKMNENGNNETNLEVKITPDQRLLKRGSKPQSIPATSPTEVTPSLHSQCPVIKAQTNYLSKKSQIS